LGERLDRIARITTLEEGNPPAKAFFEKVAAETADEEARVYRKFALALAGLVEADHVDLPRSFTLIRGGMG